PVKIKISASVQDLKEHIREKAPDLIRLGAHMLKLYLARDGRWLNSGDDDIKALQRKEVPDGIKNLMQEQKLLGPFAKLSDHACIGKYFNPVPEDIHILVGLSEREVAMECVVVCDGRTLPVKIKISAFVQDLKEHIREKAPDLIRLGAHMLKLYLARDGRWLNSGDDDIKALQRKEVPDGIKNLMQEQKLLGPFAKLSDDRKIFQSRPRRHSYPRRTV
ncbi:Crinkler (CRN), partial [Phytophthora megakarya]